eukprot:gnl/TRDRNA2_/TRDRNA2_166676_c0_seq1.p1 gnl/TRDRNA2_/TRDRNA2_166676_c0~~gnl/TRDRNA2_/TRDRNA2_166676_c0_seq1.p1  ORF type:complete len:293 (+),score=45.42 gnl/TRDRNA2_/TRDRNA2_166676_c0_seq1:72-950(+)
MTATDGEAALVLKDFAAGTVGGMLGIVAGHPFDTAKTRLQAMERFEGSSTWRVIGDTVRTEGPRALYRGMSFPFYSTALLNAIVFSVQGFSERMLSAQFGNDRPRLCGFLGGCIAGLAQSPIVCAADLVKCQRQVMHSPSGQLLGPVAILRQRVAALGVWQGCFQGLGVCALKESPSYGAYFLVYEELKPILEARGWPVAAATLTAGGASGCVSLGLIHPVDTVKTVIQALPTDAKQEERSPFRVVGAALRSGDAAKFFFRGFGAAMQRAFVINAATFGGYEFAMAQLSKLG